MGRWLIGVLVGAMARGSLGWVLQKLGIINLVGATVTAVAVGVWGWVVALPGPIIFVLALYTACGVLALFWLLVVVTDWVRHRAEGPWRNADIGGRSVRLTEEAAALFLGGRDDNQKRKFTEYVGRRPSRKRFYRADVIEATR